MNWKVERILRQLHDLYASPDKIGDYSLLYDFLDYEKHGFGIDPADKKDLWNSAKIHFKHQYRNLIGNPSVPQDWLKRELDKVYKSFLVQRYLFNKLNAGQKLNIFTEDGKILQLWDGNDV